MAAIVLESAIGSQYVDSPTSYEFPARYLKYFEPVASGEPLFAVLYEPRGDDGSGLMAYVGLARISGPPVLSERTSRTGRALYVVHFSDAVEQFAPPVPREVTGVPIEAWLRPFDRGRQRNVATLGRAVRALTNEDFTRILELAGASILESGSSYPVKGEHPQPLTALRERAEILASVLIRDGAFRRSVIAAYDRRCSVSGFDLGPISITKSAGVLDAAHIRPVRSNGSDSVTNGLPLTPTLHRFFDAGLFTAEYQDGRPVLLVSSRLEPSMIKNEERGFVLPLRDGLPLLLPANSMAWPSPEQLSFHARTVFRTD